jgi:hypothetical protein
MNKKLFIFCLATTIGVAIVFAKRTTSQDSSSSSATPVTQQTIALPEHVPYMVLFSHHYSNLQKADELAQQGKDDNQYRLMFRRRAGLSDTQAQILDQVTRDCKQELARQDAKAQAVIAEFRKQYPVGTLPEGVTLPPPPPELTQLQQERDAIILRARDRLHAAFGDEEFARFDSFVQSRIGAAIKPAGQNRVPVP